jgi:hypothetical protein
VTVWGSREPPIDSGGSTTTLGDSALRTASSVLAGDGLDAAHAMPRAVAADDFRSEVSVRGSPYRQVGIVIDGVPTTWLQHTVYGRHDAGSLSMFAGDIVDQVTLRAGAFPRRYEDTLGAELGVHLKEGSRDATRFTIRAGGTSAAFVAEGPIGNGTRGSWITGVRNSFRTWPPRPISQDDVGFAFTDVHAKLVYDVSTRNQIVLTALGGRSALDTVDEPLVGPLANGIDRAALFTVGWRSTVGSRTVVRQRVWLVGQALVSALPGGELAGRSNSRALGYRGEVLHAVAGGLLEAGAEVSGLSGSRDSGVSGAARSLQPVRATWMTRGAYANFARDVRGGLSFEGGARVSGSTLVHQSALTPWVRGAWRLGTSWTVNASAGASRQFPELDNVLNLTGSTGLVPERASHVDAGIEQRVGGAQWQVTLFRRLENDVLRQQDMSPVLTPGVGLDPNEPVSYRNSIHGTSRGLEFVVKPGAAGRLSGWMSYTYALARQADLNTRETFWSDFDRRHALNAAAAIGIGRHSSMGFVVRSASGAPIPGYVVVRDGKLFVGDRRNALRLPPYLRVDARIQRTFFSSRHAVTVFGEVLNAIDRHNLGLGDGTVQPLTGEAIGFLRPLLPRRVSVGIELRLER